MPLRFRKEEKQADEDRPVKCNIEPPEVAPADMDSHRAGNNGSNHKRAKVEGEVEGIIGATLVQEHHVGDDGRLCGLGLLVEVLSCGRTNTNLCRSSSNSIEDAGAHEAAIRFVPPLARSC